MKKQIIKTLLFVTLSLSSAIAFGAYESMDLKSYKHESKYMVGSENCYRAYDDVKVDAMFDCESKHPKCKLKTWGTSNQVPVTDYANRAQGYRFICTVYAIAQEVKDYAEELEAPLGFGENNCQQASGYFNALIARLGLQGSVHAYSRCSLDDGILFGVKTDSTPGTINATTPLPFQSMEKCLETLRGEFTSLRGPAISAASSRFSVTLYCEETQGKKAVLSGIVSLF